eukprot:TRINITY_DN19085_c0_g1_i3.p1 TRINITY_DN19085_c0_g1~~TRINITY_DN19085_c0_g1_i3.p1  ORF type:complete len:608 (-),score=153.41 TRINITY_DN19085_c0_g1_i3:594-2417(-)
MGWTLPPAPGIYCQKGQSSVCDWTDISQDKMRAIANSIDLTGEGAEGDRDANAVQISMENSTHAVSQELTFHYTVNELAVRIAKAFEIFPVDSRPRAGEDGSSSLAELVPVFGPKVKPARYDTYYEIMQESQQWVSTALDKLPGSGNLLKAWFGGDSASTYKKVRHTLLGMAKTLDNVLIKVADKCNQYTVAYVMVTTTQHGDFIRSDIQKTKDGDRYVINVCEYFWRLQDDPSCKFGTMVHEASHHHATKDEKYKGASPYGRAACLRMAEEAPDKALSNADNFQWLVFYLNRCADAPSLTTTKKSPCTLIVQGDEYATVSAKCTEPVRELTLKFLGPGGEYLKASKNWGDVKASTITLGSYGMPNNTRLELMFETECVIWQASITWPLPATQGATPYVEAPAKQYLTMAPGGTVEGIAETIPAEQPTKPPKPSLPPVRPSTPTFAPVPAPPQPGLPCELTVNTNVVIQAQNAPPKDGFQLLAKCQTAIANALLSFTGPSATSKRYNMLGFGTLRPGVAKIFSNTVEDFSGYKFKLQGDVGGKSLYTTARLGVKPPTNTTAVVPQKPPMARSGVCDLSVDDKKLKDGSPGVRLSLQCTKDVKNTVLK